MFVTKLGHYPIVLGIPWMKLHDVVIRFSSYTLTFRSQYGTAYCNQTSTVAHTITSEPPESTLCSLVSKVALYGPAVSAGAGEVVAQRITSPQMSNLTQANRSPQGVKPLPDTGSGNQPNARPDANADA
jgi:hypothetical protein